MVLFYWQKCNYETYPGTCSKSGIKPPDNSKLADTTPDNLANTFPVEAICNKNYNFEPNSQSKKFHCEDGEVNIDLKCHRTYFSSSSKVKLQMNDLCNINTGRIN